MAQTSAPRFPNDGTLGLKGLLSTAQEMKTKKLKCPDDMLRSVGVDVMLTWATRDKDNDDSFKAYRNESVDEFDVRGAVTRKESKKQPGHELVLVFMPHGKGVSGGELVRFISQAFGLAGEDLLDKVPDLPVVVRDPSGEHDPKTNSIDCVLAKSVLDSGYIEIY